MNPLTALFVLATYALVLPYIGLMILVIRGTPGRTVTAYDLGYATGI